MFEAKQKSKHLRAHSKSRPTYAQWCAELYMAATGWSIDRPTNARRKHIVGEESHITKGIVSNLMNSEKRRQVDAWTRRRVDVARGLAKYACISPPSPIIKGLPKNGMRFFFVKRLSSRSDFFWWCCFLYRRVRVGLGFGFPDLL